MELSKIFQILMEGTMDTLYMTFMSTLFSYIFGLFLGVLLYVTNKNGIMPHKFLNAVIGWVVNIGRSIPFIILMIALFPFTRIVVGKVIGPNAAIVPLVIGAAPFVARLVESSLEELDLNVIESVQCMGATRWQIIFKVLIPESIPSLVRGLSITTITLIGYTAMAGVVGAGGLGDIALRYGYHRYEYGMMIATLVLIIAIVQIVQIIFNLIAKKIDKKVI
ncbi:MAG: methionine ABC transporter permease [Oscillospiraceae bacterium]